MMKAFLLLLFIGALSSCYVLKAYKYRKFDLQDLHKFDGVALPAANNPFTFSYDTAGKQQLTGYLDNNLAHSSTYAFLVIKNDSIIYERYFGEVQQSTVMPSFSVAKSVVSTLVGIALHEGYIKSLGEPVTNYLPQLKKNDREFDKVTIQHVLDMRSGVKSNENYSNPFSDVLKMGFASNVSKPALKATLEKAAGEFDYKSVNTQLLALIVEKATGKKLQDYAVEKLWKPLGMEYPATWNVDKDNTARAFCCINAAAKDYAKFGRLFLRRGEWQGQQLVPEAWVSATVNIDTMLKYDGYKNQWWAREQRQYMNDSASASAIAGSLGAGTRMYRYQRTATSPTQYVIEHYDGSFYAQGILGQYVYVHPEKNIVIVRLGHSWSHPKFYAEGFINDLLKRL